MCYLSSFCMPSFCVLGYIKLCNALKCVTVRAQTQTTISVDPAQLSQVPEGDMWDNFE